MFGHLACFGMKVYNSSTGDNSGDVEGGRGENWK